MKKTLKRIGLAALILILVMLIAAYFFVRNTGIDYDGNRQIAGLEEEVEVNFGLHGIPHIQAASEMDAYFALGYVQAQDRLFQMDLLRRLTSGRLAELFGPELVEIDVYFRTLGLKHKAKASAAKHFQDRSQPFVRATEAYLAGVNKYMAEGKLPLEYPLLGLEREAFTVEDIYAIINYMSLGFSYTIKEDAMTSYIRTKLGPQYLNGWKLSLYPELADTLYGDNQIEKDISSWLEQEDLLEKLGIGRWWGSNSWVLGPERSASGKVLFANDTHMEYGQPSVWYEAHLSYPGMDFYGHYLPLVPFGVLGHTEKLAWGLTIFPFDNINFYREQLNLQDSSLALFQDQWEKISSRKEVIRVKGGDPVELNVRSTRHGPLIEAVDPYIKWVTKDPVALWWTVFQFESRALEGMYAMNNSEDMESFQQALEKLDVVGLYVNYGDASGNIAWWATGKLPVFREGLDGTQLLDGSSGNDEVIRFLDFEENPRLINPPEGFIATANNDPVLSGGHFVQGNYLHPGRIQRIRELLSGKSIWSIEEMKSMQLDIMLKEAMDIKALFFDEVPVAPVAEFDKSVYDVLMQWDGTYGEAGSAPLIYEKLMYHITQKTFADELGGEIMPMIYRSFLFKRSILSLFSLSDGVWWDNVTTTGHESRQDIFLQAFNATVEDLKTQYGQDPGRWHWGQQHTLTFNHALGQKKPLDRIFNVGPFEIAGGENVLNKMEYLLSADEKYPVLSGPTCRILIDFADPKHGQNINPTGQSGNLMSPYYKDQAGKFVKGEYRGMMMDWQEIQQHREHQLRLLPEK